MQLRKPLSIVLAFLVGFTLSNPSQYWATSDTHSQISELSGRNNQASYRLVNEGLIERLCSRMGNWSYAEWAHSWWSKNSNAQLVMNGYAPRNFSANFESVWADVYASQIEDLKALGCP